jgi:hypothetical protein
MQCRLCTPCFNCLSVPHVYTVPSVPVLTLQSVLQHMMHQSVTDQWLPVQQP